MSLSDIISRSCSKESLPHDEWDLQRSKDLPPEWQWHDWLNYEFARSCRPMVEAVRTIRGRQIPEREAGTFPPAEKFPRHAVYLANTYPEFPKIPWRKLSWESRATRSKHNDQVGDPFEQQAFQPWDAFKFQDIIQTGDLWLQEDRLEDQKYAVFKIDYLRSQDLIMKQFRHWLEKRRPAYIADRKAFLKRLSELRAKHKDLPGANLEAKPPKQLQKSTQMINAGKGKNRSKYFPLLKNLAALRLLEYHEYDYAECAAQTKDNHKSLYTGVNSTKWFDAAKMAVQMLLRFEIMWDLSTEPAYIFRFDEEFEDSFCPMKTQAKLNEINSIPKVKSEQWVKLLEEHYNGFYNA
jgi:hypothetical protein